MSACPSCHAENPPGSKFCAGCGAALPKTPVDVRCAACGAASPEGSRFCKGCGRPLVAGSIPGGPPPGGGPGAGTARPGGAKAPSQDLQRVKMLLGGGAALYALGVFLMYSQLSQMRTMYGAYAGQMPGVGLQWFLIVVDAALACLNVYAVSLVTKGQFKYAKWLFAAMAALGAIFLLRAFSGPVIYIFLNAGLLAGGVWGWMLVSREEKALAA